MHLFLDYFPYRGYIVLPDKWSQWQIWDFVFTTKCLCPITACFEAYLSNFMFQFRFLTAYVICSKILWKDMTFLKVFIQDVIFYWMICQKGRENPQPKHLIKPEKNIICLLLTDKFATLCSRGTKMLWEIPLIFTIRYSTRTYHEIGLSGVGPLVRLSHLSSHNYW